ncbi:hypothetical protein BTHERMOSOX_850 [Bathymodiolus thermophilus thioautotrophic gill symbiont]|nr:hypothetical protein BTHERMOSOX_850 [Bathymodiolus thermophilus thioautotrophic gill symbiont]
MKLSFPIKQTVANPALIPSVVTLIFADNALVIPLPLIVLIPCMIIKI